jgi:hypothetical protein
MAGKSAVRGNIHPQEAVQLGRIWLDLESNQGESALIKSPRQGMLRSGVRGRRLRSEQLANALPVDAHNEWGNHLTDA